MTESYKTVLKIEVMNEFISGVYGQQLNKVLAQDLETDDLSSFDVLILQQMKQVKRIDLFKCTQEDLTKIDHYWLAMNEFLKFEKNL